MEEESRYQRREKLIKKIKITDNHSFTIQTPTPTPDPDVTETPTADSAEAEATETPAAEEQTDVTETPETEGDLQRLMRRLQTVQKMRQLLHRKLRNKIQCLQWNDKRKDNEPCTGLSYMARFL